MALRLGELARERGEDDTAIRWFERVLTKKIEADAKHLARAAAHLATLLVSRGEAIARVCELAARTTSGLDNGDPVRAEASPLARKRCAGHGLHVPQSGL